MGQEGKKGGNFFGVMLERMSKRTKERRTLVGWDHKRVHWNGPDRTVWGKRTVDTYYLTEKSQSTEEQITRVVWTKFFILG